MILKNNLKIGFRLFSILVFLTLFARLYFADDTISYDRKFYIQFFTNLDTLDINAFLQALIGGFPYFKAESALRFEVGFALISYPLSSVFSPSFVWAILGVSILLFKSKLLLLANVPIFWVALLFIFSLLFQETNMLRVAVAVTFFMYSLFLHYNGKRVWFFFLAFSCLCHVSMIAFAGIFIISQAISRVTQRKSVIFLFFLCSLALILFINPLAEIIGGKLGEYAFLANEHDMYQGSSGLKLTSLISLLILAHSISCYRLQVNNNEISARLKTYSTFYVLLSGFVTLLVLFGGALSIVGDRLWQSSIIILIQTYGLTKKQYSRNLSSYSINLCTFIIVFIFVISNPIFRYPQTNLFYPFIEFYDFNIIEKLRQY